MQDILDQARHYLRYARTKANAHFRMAEIASRRHTQVGVPVTLATAVVGTSIFASLGASEQSVWLQIGAGLLSLVASVLSALQTFFGFSEVAAQHRDAASEYEASLHALDVLILRYQHAAESERGTAIEDFGAISKTMDQVTKRAPTIPDRVYDEAAAALARSPWGTSTGQHSPGNTQ